MATAAPTAVTAEADRLGAGSVTACTAETVGTWTMTGEATPVKWFPAVRELVANVMLPATNQNTITTQSCLPLLQYVVFNRFPLFI